MKAYRQVFFMELRKLTTYRLDFWVNFIGITAFKLVISYYLWLNIFEYTGKSEIGGYTFKQIVLYYIIASVLYKILQAGMIGNIANDIYQGSLNKYILYPIDFFNFKITSYLAHAFVYLMQLIIAITAYHYFIAPVLGDLGFIDLILFSVSILLGGVCYFFMNAICELIAFWADNIWSLSVMLRFFMGFFGGVMIPLTMFPSWAQEIISYTPFPYFISVSLNVFWSKATHLETLAAMGIQIVWTFIFYGACKYIYMKGRYKYTGVGI
ncbi:MAG: ABC-2 family transporter protein [Bacteriovoracaceae bacterium]|jgi:ABC-2 type transport system permease protein|nr:ABC-2 family transporter protein [Bacteriovoracaceae bacterium]